MYILPVVATAVTFFIFVGPLGRPLFLLLTPVDAPVDDSPGQGVGTNTAGRGCVSCSSSSSKEGMEVAEDMRMRMSTTAGNKCKVML